MNRNEMIVLVSICALGAVGLIAGAAADAYKHAADIKAQIEADAALERSKVEESTKLKRTQERVKALPWVKD